MTKKEKITIDLENDSEKIQMLQTFIIKNSKLKVGDFNIWFNDSDLKIEILTALDDYSYLYDLIEKEFVFINAKHK